MGRPDVRMHARRSRRGRDQGRGDRRRSRAQGPALVTGEDGRVSFLHATVNRNKRSLTLDLRRDEGREIFLKLAAVSDVVVQNFRPGTFDKWGIGYAHCRTVNPAIIYVSISGYGQFGPDHDRVGYDPIAEAASGFMSLNGSPDGRPVDALPTYATISQGFTAR